MRSTTAAKTAANGIAGLFGAIAQRATTSQSQPGKLRLELAEHVDQRNGKARNNHHEQQCQVRNGQHL
jgi:hypothetical protein